MSEYLKPEQLREAYLLGVDHANRGWKLRSIDDAGIPMDGDIPLEFGSRPVLYDSYRRGYENRREMMLIEAEHGPVDPVGTCPRCGEKVVFDRVQDLVGEQREWPSGGQRQPAADDNLTSDA